MVDYPLEQITEGKTTILVPDVEAFRKAPDSYPPSDAPVFYNNKMEINRDFALAALRVYRKMFFTDKELFYCEPMAGSGVRSVRVAFEEENIVVIMNDVNPLAVELMKENVKQLGIQGKTKVCHRDANELLIAYNSHKNHFDVIDLDPFGSPAPFIDPCAQAINNHGLLAITSTDMATMCGVYPKACIRKYLSQPIHTSIAHELAIRMQLAFIATHLARHEKAMQALFVHSTAHFIRTYVLTEKNITKAKKSLENLGYVAQCPTCYQIESSIGLINNLPKICPICKKKRLLGGPYWLGKLFDHSFVSNLQKEAEENEKLYGTSKKMIKIIRLIANESLLEKENAQIIGYYDIHELADNLNIPCPKTKDLMSTLHTKGYICSKTHFRPHSIKTNAKVAVINAIMKQLVQKS